MIVNKRTAASLSAAVKAFADIPGPRTFPFLGSLSVLRFSEDAVHLYHEDLKKMYKKYGPIFKETYPLGQGPLVHVFSPDIAREVFAAEGRWPYIVPLQSTTQKYRMMRGMNPGLGNLNGEEWYRLRSGVSQAMMRPEAVFEYLPNVNQVAQSLVDHIAVNRDDKGEADMFVIAARWSLESAGLTVFEKRLGALTTNVAWADELIKINKEAFRLSAKMRFLPLYKFATTPSWKRMIEIEDKYYWEIDRLSLEAIQKLTTAADEDTIVKFASKLINKPTLNVKDVKTILFSLFSDGLSTTAPTLIYNLFALAKNPDHQAKLRDEVTTVNTKGEEWTRELLNRVPFLRACIKETFRMHTLTSEISRIPQVDVELGGYHVPAGTPVDIHTSLLGRDPVYFNDPETFKPSRWIRDSDEKEESQPFLNIPFGHGPRMCAGRRFADQDLMVVLAHLVANYHISYNHGDLETSYEATIVPAGNLRFQFTPIQ